MQSTDSRQRKKLQFHNRESVCLPCFFIFNSKSTIASQIFCGWVEERRLRFGALICCHGGSFLSFSGAVYRTFQCEMTNRPSICPPTRILSGKYVRIMSSPHPGKKRRPPPLNICRQTLSVTFERRRSLKSRLSKVRKVNSLFSHAPRKKGDG